LGLAGCASQSTDHAQLAELYRQSISRAAVKRSGDVHKLQAIDPSWPVVKVVHVQAAKTIDIARFIWVALPDELQRMCRGKPDPLLAIQQALGLPPEADNGVQVFSFTVRSKDIFRPCASSAETNTDECSIDIQEEPRGDPLGEHFVLKQLMDSTVMDSEVPATLLLLWVGALTGPLNPLIIMVFRSM
jgi:hypothetical protein